MNDRELLQAAAKAAGMTDLTEWSDAIRDHDSPHWGGPALHQSGMAGECNSWNPLTDDGDALRLAVKLNLWVNVYSPSQSTPQFVNVIFHEPFHDVYEELGSDPYAATRRAIVRAAAALGEQQ